MDTSYSFHFFEFFNLLTGNFNTFIRNFPFFCTLKSFDDFGLSSLGLEQNDFIERGNVIQIGYPPLRADFLTEISGVSWEEAWSSRITATLGGIPVSFISRENLIRNKKAAGRPVDLGDLDRLN